MKKTTRQAVDDYCVVFSFVSWYNINNGIFLYIWKEKDMDKKEKIIITGILLLYAAMLIAGYAAKVLDWDTIKANYLIAPGLAAVTMGLGKKWFGYSMLACAVAGLLIYYILLLCGITAPGAIINMALLAVGVFAGIILDLRKKDV